LTLTPTSFNNLTLHEKNATQNAFSSRTVTVACTLLRHLTLTFWHRNLAFKF
jgi:hypothetical protein